MIFQTRSTSARGLRSARGVPRGRRMLSLNPLYRNLTCENPYGLTQIGHPGHPAHPWRALGDARGASNTVGRLFPAGCFFSRKWGRKSWVVTEIVTAGGHDTALASPFEAGR